MNNQDLKAVNNNPLVQVAKFTYLDGIKSVYIEFFDDEYSHSIEANDFLFWLSERERYAVMEKQLSA